MITVENLTYTYKSTDDPAIRNLNFELRPGEILGFLGPSGAGKSTTQKILIGLLRDYEGSVSIFDKDLTEWESNLYERIGVSFEVPNLYLKLSGRENLAYFSALYEGPTQSADDLLALVGLQDDGDLLVSQYSKGMKNRLNVARALLHNPELLFLDEPTAGLDPVNARRVKEIIQAQRDAGRTVFLTTHDMAVADQLCDRVAFITEGEIAVLDTPRALKLQYGEPNVRVEYGRNGAAAAAEFPLSGLADNAQFLGLLRGDDLQTIHSQEATLETIFIDVTGRSLA